MQFKDEAEEKESEIENDEHRSEMDWNGLKLKHLEKMKATGNFSRTVRCIKRL